MGGTIPRQVVLGCKKKLVEQARECELESSIPLRRVHPSLLEFLLGLPSVMDCDPEVYAK